MIKKLSSLIWKSINSESIVFLSRQFDAQLANKYKHEIIINSIFKNNFYIDIFSVHWENSLNIKLKRIFLYKVIITKISYNYFSTTKIGKIRHYIYE